tara:strand:- start:1226 stop:1492 length:267 start_codon:yes stop_codon:yes gene_type:complete
MVGNWFKRSICSLSSTTIFYTTAGFEALFSKWYICAIYTIHYSPNLLYYYLLLNYYHRKKKNKKTKKEEEEEEEEEEKDGTNGFFFLD